MLVSRCMCMSGWNQAMPDCEWVCLCLHGAYMGEDASTQLYICEHMRENMGMAIWMGRVCTPAGGVSAHRCVSIQPRLETKKDTVLCTHARVSTPTVTSTLRAQNMPDGNALLCHP